ncbi:MAG: hypothetical protein H8E10_10700 [Desulfobacterales bacterium]|nr:hypothetical protein [Desulfobacterales bacterium]
MNYGLIGLVWVCLVFVAQKAYRKKIERLNNEHSENIEWLCKSHQKVIDIVKSQRDDNITLCNYYINEIDAMKRQLANRNGQITKLKKKISNG